MALAHLWLSEQAPGGPVILQFGLSSRHTVNCCIQKTKDEIIFCHFNYSVKPFVLCSIPDIF